MTINTNRHIASERVAEVAKHHGSISKAFTYYNENVAKIPIVDEDEELAFHLSKKQ